MGVSRGSALVLAAAAVAVLFAGCGDGDGKASSSGGTVATTGPSGTPRASAQAQTVTIEGFAFSGLDGHPAGSRIEVRNQDSVAHTFTADDGAFDTGMIDPGDEAKVTLPEQPGEYAVHCSIHPSMKGALVVE